MTAPAPEKCDECGASPVELVLYPIAIHCRLGGTSYTNSLGDVIIGGPENIQVIDEVLGRSAPQPPAKGNPYAPGCIVGNANFAK